MKTKLDEDFKKEWIENLLNGKFEQGEERLRDEEGRHCCLGVAAAIRAPEILEKFPGYGSPCHRGKSWTNADACVWHSDLKPLLYSPDGLWINTPMFILSNMNDNGSTFKEIAEYIQENL